jgi:hypothetical protein
LVISTLSAPSGSTRRSTVGIGDVDDCFDDDDDDDDDSDSDPADDAADGDDDDDMLLLSLLQQSIAEVCVALEL